MIKDILYPFWGPYIQVDFRYDCFTKISFRCECYFNLMLYTALCLYVKYDTGHSYGNKLISFDFDLFIEVWVGMGLLSDTSNCMRRECRERFPRHHS